MPQVPSPRPAVSQQPAKPAGQAFDREARLLFRVAACTGDEPIPPELEATVTAHCDALLPYIEHYRTRYLQRAGPFLAALQPHDLPTTVIYPFGGGDLLSALTTYPTLSVVTTLSLEHAGDPRRVADADPESLEDSLRRLKTA